MASKWYATEKFSAAAYRLFRNYNGKNATFGALACHSSTTNRDSTSVWSSISADRSTLHIIGINKASSIKSIEVQIASSTSFDSAQVWGFGGNDTSITRRGSVVAIQGNIFTYAFPPLSVLHFVLPGRSAATGMKPLRSAESPSVAFKNHSISLVLPRAKEILFIDASGKVVSRKRVGSTTHSLSVNSWAKGVYFVNAEGKTGEWTRFVVK